MDHPNDVSRRFVLRSGAAGAVLLGAGGLLAACSSSSGSPAKSAGTAGGKPKQGGNLRLGMTEAASTDTADVTFAASTWDYALGFLVYDRLNADFISGGFQPMLAEEISIPTSTTCTIRLRSGLEFHNGKTISADDLIATLQRIINPKNPGAVASLLNIDATSLRKVDSLTVSFSLTSPNTFLPSHLASLQSGIVPADYNPNAPVGSGPFMLKNFQPGTGATLTRFPNYWTPPPYIDTLTVTGYSTSPALIDAMKSGAADAATTFSLSDLATLQGGNVEILTHPAGGFFPYVMLSDKPPFNDVKVRQAMRLLVNRSSLVTELLDGHGRVGNDLFGPNDQDFDSALPQRVQDVDQAKSLLRSAGMNKLTLDMATSPFLANAEVVLAQQLSSLGVTINVTNVDATTFYSKYYAQSPLFVSYWLNQPLARIDGLCYVPNAHFPETGWSDPTYLSLFTQARAQPDAAKRRELMIQMQQLYYDQGPWLIWGFEDEVDAITSNVHGASQDASGFPFNRFLAFKDMWLD